MRALAATLLAALGLVACTPRPPRLGPGSVAATRLSVGDGGVRVLATENVVDHRSRDSDPDKEAAVAEDPGELHDLWRRWPLPGPEPSVDFGERLVVAFTEPSFCNDGKLTGAVLTSAGELVPRTEATDQTCILLGIEGAPSIRVYVASLPRRAFPAGTYLLRASRQGDLPFTVHGPVRAAPPTPAPPAAPAPLASRRARVVARAGAGVDRTGVWVRDDAVWAPRGPIDGPPAGAVCAGPRCAPILVTVACAAPECPAPGWLLVLDRPLVPAGAWPTEEAAWNHLMDDLAGDPEIAALFPGGRAPRFPHPLPPHRDPVGWVTPALGRFKLETSISGVEGRFLGGGPSFGGGDLRFGGRYSPYSSHDSTGSGRLRKVLVGDAWGIDVHLRGLAELHAAGVPRTWFGAGIAIAADQTIGDDNDKSRVRLPSLLALAMPEVGVMDASDTGGTFYTAHSLPVAILLTQHLALEARPSFTLRFSTTAGAAGATAALASFSLGLLLR